MTIDSGWMRVFKEEAPDAFSPKYPFHGHPNVAYIDGMPLLMIAESHVHSWEDLLRHNFARHIQRYFRMGCRVVVLAFDDYERVPVSKSITQANRSKRKAPYEFGEGQQLPCSIPQGYNEKLANRVFKRRVIDMVCNRLVEHILMPADAASSSSSAVNGGPRKLVIDYTGCPIMFESDASSNRFNTSAPTFMTDVPPMGEADIKFGRWADHFGGNVVAYSVDGDFVMIALLKHERNMQAYSRAVKASSKQRLASTGGEGEAPLPVVPGMTIYRLKYQMPVASAPAPCKRQRLLGTAAPAAAAHGAGGSQQQRRLVLVSQEAQRGSAPAQGTDGDAKKRKPREFEYVDIPKLYAALREAMGSMCASTVPRRRVHRYHYMRMLAVMVGICGTDFSRGFPQIGPATLWAMMHEEAVMRGLLSCYVPASHGGRVRARLACGALASAIYAKKYASHFSKAKPLPSFGASRARGEKEDEDEEEDEKEEDELDTNVCSDDEDGDQTSGLQIVLRTLQGSGLSDKTKNDLPTVRRIEATFRNVNWILQYWRCNPPTLRRDEEGQRTVWDYSACFPDPVCAKYGFKYAVRNSSKGAETSSCRAAVQWMDVDD